MANGTCSVEGCEDPASARKLCKKHYASWWWENRRHVRVKRVVKVVEPKPCIQCGIVMEKGTDHHSKWVSRKFCSLDCRYAWRRGRPNGPSSRVQFACEQCGDLVTVDAYRLRGDYPARFCGHACFAANRDQGVTSANKRVRMSAEYRHWREAVFDRDDYTCQFCGKRGGVLQADHIKPFAFFPELRFDVSNGRTLCVPCHRTTPTYAARSWPPRSA